MTTATGDSTPPVLDPLGQRNLPLSRAIWISHTLNVDGVMHVELGPVPQYLINGSSERCLPGAGRHRLPSLGNVAGSQAQGYHLQSETRSGPTSFWAWQLVLKGREVRPAVLRPPDPHRAYTFVFIASLP